jgi:thioredoxin 2
VDAKIHVVCPSCDTTNRVARERRSAGARCGTCKEALFPAKTIELRKANFDRHIAANDLPVVGDFWAPWCGPCRMVAPELQKVAARQAGRFLVVKVNTDELSDLGERFRIQSIPTMAVFAGGREVARTTGARPASDIETFVESATQKVNR